MHLIKEELIDIRRRGMRPGSREELTAILTGARREGFSFTSDFIHGLSGIAAPVFDSNRCMIFALIALGYTTPFCARREHIALHVLQTARALSQRLGHG
jgi:DNA-binding IclR family transcriptional regulator